MNHASFQRHHEVRRIRDELERDGFPRLQMSLLVALTGGVGFVASYLLLRAGLAEMWLRYPAALGIAYAAFLLLLWLWLRTRAEDYADVPDLLNASPPSPGSCAGTYSGQGGQSGGGGASASFDDGAAEADAVGDALASAAEAEEFAIPLVLVVLVGALLLSSFVMVYSAPVLFAELLVDGVLSASLYRRLRGLRARHWLETAIRRTAWTFAATAVIVCAAGWAMAWYAPGAHSIGDVLARAGRSA